MSIREKLAAAYDAYIPLRDDGHTQRFIRLLDAEAWLDAAMMLSGDWELCLQRWPLGGWSVSIWIDEQTEYVGDEVLPTPAEALLAAIEKART